VLNPDETAIRVCPGRLQAIVLAWKAQPPVFLFLPVSFFLFLFILMQPVACLSGLDSVLSGLDARMDNSWSSL
jgi:hypothetical protein